MNISPDGIALIHAAELCVLQAYLDVAGVPTIGWGTTRYPDGRKVMIGESCTQAEADAYCAHDLRHFELAVDALTTNAIVQRQFDALVSFTYNVGEGAYQGSTLRRLVNVDPGNLGIRAQFMRWYHADGKPIKGLWNRRHREADFYYGVVTPRPPFPGI